MCDSEVVMLCFMVGVIPICAAGVRCGGFLPAVLGPEREQSVVGRRRIHRCG